MERTPPPPVWPMSLLWPSTSDRTSVVLHASAVLDLALDHVIRAIDLDHRHDRHIRAALTHLPLDPAVVCYRQDILDDLLVSPALTQALSDMLPELQALGGQANTNWPDESPLGMLVARLRELDMYVHCIDRLHALLAGAADLASEGLRALRSAMTMLAAHPDVVALRDELPALREIVGEAASVTIGLNLGRDLQPESVTIVELNRFQFRGPRSLLGRLLPSTADNSPSGITPLMSAGPAPIRRDSQLFKELQRLLEATTAPLTKALARYRDLHTGPVAALEGELAFWIGAAALVRRLERAGLGLCRPAIAPADEHAFAVRDLANLTLSLQLLPREGDNGAPPPNLSEQVVTNDADFSTDCRMLMVTGPNRGGKTTFCRAVGQAQVLAQAGLHVLGTSARISVVDGIWTHFPLPEADRPGAGRLDEEVQRLRAIFGEITGASLVLLNEPLTSTSERDALAIATDIVRAFQEIGARVVLITHLHDLALLIPDLNARGPQDCTITSLVAQTVAVGDGVRGTFKIVAGTPDGHSYAAEIARQHGLTFAQLEELRKERETATTQPT
jgi:DNA mismatch repair protein MutS